MSINLRNLFKGFVFADCGKLIIRPTSAQQKPKEKPSNSVKRETERRRYRKPETTVVFYFFFVLIFNFHFLFSETERIGVLVNRERKRKSWARSYGRVKLAVTASCIGSGRTHSKILNPINCGLILCHVYLNSGRLTTCRVQLVPWNYLWSRTRVVSRFHYFGASRMEISEKSESPLRVVVRTRNKSRTKLSF